VNSDVEAQHDGAKALLLSSIKRLQKNEGVKVGLTGTQNIGRTQRKNSAWSGGQRRLHKGLRTTETSAGKCDPKGIE